MSNNYFTDLKNMDLSNKFREKGDVVYLPWSAAWDAAKEVCPDATYEIKKNENGFPYFYDPATGYMVAVSVTIKEISHEMWLAVMDGNNCAMKSEPYTCKRDGMSFNVEPATTTDINRTIMRCLVKALAMHGIGLSAYCKEGPSNFKHTLDQAPPPQDYIPEPPYQEVQKAEERQTQEQISIPTQAGNEKTDKASSNVATEEQRKVFFEAIEKSGRDKIEVMREAGWKSGRMTKAHYEKAMEILRKETGAK